MSVKLVQLLNSPIQLNITGSITFTGPYDNATDYGVGDAVSYNGSTYVMFSDAGAGTLPTNSTYWTLLTAGSPFALAGGSANQALIKNSGTDYDLAWATINKTFVGLGNVDNTTDLNKPISTATQTALDLKQGLDSTLTALAGYNTNGILTQTAADTFVGRILTGTSNQVIITNGDGVAGAPTFSLPQDIHTGASPTFLGLTLTNLTVDTNTLFVDSTNNAVGFLTTAPTHTITLESTATGIALHRVADQVTNYERFRMYWNSTVATIGTDVGGTGTNRNLALSAGAVTMTIVPSASSGNGVFRFPVSTGIAGAYVVNSSGSLSASSGTQGSLLVNPTFTQTGSAGYNAILVNVTETTTGSGTKYLFRAQVGSTDKFLVSNSGIVTGAEYVQTSSNGIYSSTTASFNKMSGGTLDDGAVIGLGGSTHATLASIGVLRVGATEISRWDTNGITIADAKNIILNTTTGTKIGTSTTQKLGFWNATPIAKPTTGIAGATFVAGAGTAVNDASTFGGYTLKQIAQALINMGLLT